MKLVVLSLLSWSFLRMYASPPTGIPNSWNPAISNVKYAMAGQLLATTNWRWVRQVGWLAGRCLMSKWCVVSVAHACDVVYVRTGCTHDKFSSFCFASTTERERFKNNFAWIQNTICNLQLTSHVVRRKNLILCAAAPTMSCARRKQRNRPERQENKIDAAT